MTNSWNDSVMNKATIELAKAFLDIQKSLGNALSVNMSDKERQELIGLIWVKTNNHMFTAMRIVGEDDEQD